MEDKYIETFNNSSQFSRRVMTYEYNLNTMLELHENTAKTLLLTLTSPIWLPVSMTIAVGYGLFGQDIPDMKRHQD